MNNQRGGIISTVFVIPVGVALMVGFFFLGYYVGKYQGKQATSEVMTTPLPEVGSKSSPDREEFTFYKTLTDKENKTVSIEFKPKPAADENRNEKQSGDRESGKDKGTQIQKEKKSDAKSEKMKQPASRETEPKLQPVKKETVAARPSNQQPRYTLQIASYQEKAMAEDEVKKMKQKGYAAFIVTSDLQEKGTWYRVKLGSFSNKASAEKLQKELKAKEGITPFITIE